MISISEHWNIIKRSFFIQFFLEKKDAFILWINLFRRFHSRIECSSWPCSLRLPLALHLLTLDNDIIYRRTSILIFSHLKVLFQRFIYQVLISVKNRIRIVNLKNRVQIRCIPLSCSRFGPKFGLLFALFLRISFLDSEFI